MSESYCEGELAGFEGLCYTIEMNLRLLVFTRKDVLISVLDFLPASIENNSAFKHCPLVALESNEIDGGLSSLTLSMHQI